MLLNKENLKRWSIIKRFIIRNKLDVQVNICKDTIWVKQKGFAIDSGWLVVNSDMRISREEATSRVKLGLIDGFIIKDSFNRLAEKLKKDQQDSIKREAEFKEAVRVELLKDNLDAVVANLDKVVD